MQKINALKLRKGSIDNWHKDIRFFSRLTDSDEEPLNLFTYKHKWQDGDLLIWINVTTMHSATPIPDTEERLLYRILTKGDLPVI